MRRLLSRCLLLVEFALASLKIALNQWNSVSVTRRTTVRDSVNVVDDFYDIYG
jgi:hypothetical protein